MSRVRRELKRFSLKEWEAALAIVQGVVSALRRRYLYTRMIESDGGKLIRDHGVDAVDRALDYDAAGQASLFGGRREGHWLRVARCISRRPLPTRIDSVFG